MISVVIPTCNEMKNNYLPRILQSLVGIENIEVICVDSHSSDGTLELINKFPFKIITITTTSRAARLNAGVAAASGEILLLHHPRSLLTRAGIISLSGLKNCWGAYTHQFDHASALLKFTSFWSNYIRPLHGVFYLDHCIFLTTDLAQKVFPLPEVDIFEDTILSKRLSQINKPLRLKERSLTSAIRFKTNGIFKQALHNQILKWRFYFKGDHKKMNQAYEKKLGLNSNYDH